MCEKSIFENLATQLCEMYNSGGNESGTESPHSFTGNLPPPQQLKLIVGSGCIFRMSENILNDFFLCLTDAELFGKEEKKLGL